MKNTIISTEDGSFSIYNELVDDTYHSIHGAITESQIVYIENGFCYTYKNFVDKEIRIFEVGFGTGLNALLTAIESYNNKIKVIYHTIEAFPLETNIMNELNFSEIIGGEISSQLFSKINCCKWNDIVNIHDFFSLKKEHIKLESCDILQNDYNLVYYDAFGPSKQPEMWTVELLEKVCLGLKQYGTFVTYSTKGDLKRMLKSFGFIVEKLNGPPGKREVLRAIKL